MDSIYRGYRDHFPDIAIATAKFPISRYRDDRDLSVCLVSSDEDEIDTKALLKMINGLAKASSASVARLNEVETKLIVKDEALGTFPLVKLRL